MGAYTGAGCFRSTMHPPGHFLLLERLFLARRKMLYGIIGGLFYQKRGGEQVMKLNSCLIRKSGCGN